MQVDTILCGDALERLRELPDACVDAVVTDPPAGIAFMGKDWDAFRRAHNPEDVGPPNVFGRVSRTSPHSYGESDRGYFIATMTEIFAECLRVTKPGGHALVWALPRTSHWTGMALEDAGWEVRDRLAHIFGQGFPKSLNLHGEHEGWGTALKPAVEDWWLCRKPLAEPTVAANVLRYGTGALNVDGCRIEAHGRPLILSKADQSVHTYGHGLNGSKGAGKTDAGRWPPNLLLSHSLFCTSDACHDSCTVRMLNEQSGVCKSGGYPPAGGMRSQVAAYGKPSAHGEQRFTRSEGGASRYFPTFRYVAKASRRERNAGCERLPAKAAGVKNASGRGFSERDPYAEVAMTNHHPTVKPVDLMRWLVRLVTPPGGLVLDPFAGSGTTALACTAEGAHYIVIEREAEYIDIARARIANEIQPVLWSIA